MRTTLNKIREHSPCLGGWEKLLRHLGETKADDEPLSIETILDSNGFNDALWCLRAVDGHERDLRLYAAWCVRRVEHLKPNPASVSARDVAERYARALVTDDELKAAWAVAAEAAWAAAWAADRAAWAAGKKEKAAQAEELRRICREIESGRDPYPEENGR